MQGLECFELYPIMYNPWWHSKIFYFVVLFCCLIFGAALSWFSYKRWLVYYYRFDRVFIRYIVAASKAIYPTDLSIKSFYGAITFHLKEYLQDRYHLSLKDKHDQELVDFLHSNLPENMIPLLQDFLNRAFHIKFAGQKVNQEQVKSDLAMLLILVKRTRP